ncbi:site-specific DNA-methyltransferase [uncultured Serinicoccus sp.]|uniref:site-specific DNA-methyltransferase n=1 Tax=uncultured Serinicoccus sp. TaxID=735514 RepID=UPI0026093C18|nr:site-specific DNA-methyltransferase [uncultured Serinicoccus sp.]
MEKLRMTPSDPTAKNVAQLAELFPNVITETLDVDGSPVLAVDFDLLRQELSDHIVEGPRERYQLDWPGKRAAAFAANAPIAKTLRPVRAESVNFDLTKNLFIEGDNLDALKLLQESYLGKVKLIYIDPPYNTGNDFVYRDDFVESASDYLRRSGQTVAGGARLYANTESNGRFHSDWLSMMYPRLRLARNLLTSNGVIVISIDDSEISRLTSLCDEVFGADNHVETLVWKRRYGGGAKERHFASIHEYLVVYARDLSQLEELFVDLTDEQIDRYFKSTDQNSNTRGPYRTQPLEPAASMGDRPNLRFPIAAPDGSELWPKRQWLWSRERVAEASERGELEFRKGKNGWQVSIKQYLNDEAGARRKTKATSIVEGIYGQLGSAELKKLFGGKDVFPYAKPSALVQRLVDIFTVRDSLVLDFFAGSGSTAHGVMTQCALDRVPRRWILVQLGEAVDARSEAGKAGYGTIAELARDRIRLAGTQIDGGDGMLDGNLDVGFRSLRVDSTNMAHVLIPADGTEQAELPGVVESVKPDRRAEDLLFQVLLDWGLDLSLPIVRERVEGYEVFGVDDDGVVACFADNVTEGFVHAIAKRRPLRVVFKDSGFATDAARINAEQVFREASPETEVRTI